MWKTRARFSNIVLGLFFVVIGIGYIGNVCDWWHFSLFFSGWWTLFIIVPCAVSMIRDGVHAWNVIGVLIGLSLFLDQMRVIPYGMVWRLIVPVIFVVIGICIMFGGRYRKNKGEYQEKTYTYQSAGQQGNSGGQNNGNFNNNSGNADYGNVNNGSTANGNTSNGNNTTYSYTYTSGGSTYGGQAAADGTASADYAYYEKSSSEDRYHGPIPKYNSVFSSQRHQFENVEFKGASVESVFGSNQLDLRNADMSNDATIYCSAVFGSIEILVPAGVNVRIMETAFGGVKNMVNGHYEGRPTLFINASCALGGITVRS